MSYLYCRHQLGKTRHLVCHIFTIRFDQNYFIDLFSDKLKFFYFIFRSTQIIYLSIYSVSWYFPKLNISQFIFIGTFMNYYYKLFVLHKFAMKKNTPCNKWSQLQFSFSKVVVVCFLMLYFVKFSCTLMSGLVTVPLVCLSTN